MRIVGSLVIAIVALCSACEEAPNPCSPAAGVELNHDDPNNRSGEIVSAAVPQPPEVEDDDAVVWPLTLDDSTSLRIRLPAAIVFPGPDRADGACCDIRLPATTTTRREVQIFADGALWFELSAPRPSSTTPGMHASIDERVDPLECIAADGALATRHAMSFPFSLDSAGWQGDEFQGLIDNSAVLGVIVNDIIVGDELPQAVIGRNGPLDRL